MGRIYGSRRAREYAQQEKNQAVEYPPLPVSLLRIIYEGQGINISRRASTYVVLINGSFFNADDVNLSKWLLRHYGELDAEKFTLACTLLGERIRQEIIHYERAAKQAENEERRAMTSTWTSGGDNLKSFFGR